VTVSVDLSTGPGSRPASRLSEQVVVAPADMPALGFVVDWQVADLAGAGPGPAVAVS